MTQHHEIIETLAGQFLYATEIGGAEFAHVWNGVVVKRVNGGFADETKVCSILVRKVGLRGVGAAQQTV